MVKETLLCTEMKRFGLLQEEKVNSKNNKKPTWEARSSRSSGGGLPRIENPVGVIFDFLVTKALDPLDWLNARGLKILNITANLGLKDGGKRKNRKRIE